MEMLDQSLDNSSISEPPLKSEVVDLKPVDLIIEEDGSLSDDGARSDGLTNVQAILDGDESEQYQWKSNDSSVKYRVYQVNSDELEDGTDVRGSAFVEQTSPEQGEVGGSSQQQVTTVFASNMNSNHFYVVKNESGLASFLPRPLIPRSGVVLSDTRAPANTPVTVSNITRVRRDDRRRATHNEVERRRRDKINNWIAKLSKIIPDCGAVDNKTLQSKGGILATACDYITELKDENTQLQSCVKEKERLTNHINYLQQQNEKLKMENALLRSQIRNRFPNSSESNDVQPESNSHASNS